MLFNEWEPKDNYYCTVPRKDKQEYKLGKMKALAYRGDDVRANAHNVKSENPDELLRWMSIKNIANYIIQQNSLTPKDIIVPAPQHTGRADYTLKIANIISDATGCKVCDCLGCEPRDTLYNMKKRTGYKSKVSSGLYLIKEPPKYNCYFLDNIIASGQTFRDARELIPHIKPLAYAVSTKAKLRTRNRKIYIDEGILMSFKDIYKLKESESMPVDEIKEAFCILMDWDVTPDMITDVKLMAGNIAVIITPDMDYMYNYEEDCLLDDEEVDDYNDFIDNDGPFDASFEESYKVIYGNRLSEGSYTTFTNHVGEKDSFYDPYKKEPTLAELDAGAGDTSYSPTDWKTRFERDIDFSTKEGCEKAANRFESEYFSDLVHDIAHDGDRADARDCERALFNLRSKALRGALALGLTSADCNGYLSNLLSSYEQQERNRIAAEKRKASKVANQEKRLQKYHDELKGYYDQLPQEIKDLLNDNGYYSERKSWGVIKDYFNEPYGKTLKNMWVNQFG